MSEFKFKKGEFVQLKANSVIHLGRLERNIYEGDIVEFDGMSLKFNGQSTDMPELKAGIKRGWLTIIDPDDTTVEVENQVVEATPEPKKSSAPAPAKKEMAVQKVYDEERSVAEVNPKEKSSKTKFPLVIENQDDDIREVAFVKSKSGAEVSSASSANDGIAESQGAEAVSSIKLKTASNTKTVISDGAQASSEISKLDNMEASSTQIKEASGLDDILDADDADEVPVVDEQAVEDAQLLQAIEGEVQPSQGAVAIGKDDSKIKVLAGGVEWDTSKHWSKRAKIALEMYGEDQPTLDAIMAIETKGVINAIKKGLGE